MTSEMLNALFDSINRLTEINITPDGDGYVWQWRCLESKVFVSQRLALIDWINTVCKDHADLMVERSNDEEDENEIDGKNDKDFSTIIANFDNSIFGGSPDPCGTVKGKTNGDSDNCKIESAYGWVEKEIERIMDNLIDISQTSEYQAIDETVSTKTSVTLDNVVSSLKFTLFTVKKIHAEVHELKAWKSKIDFSAIFTDKSAAKTANTLSGFASGSVDVGAGVRREQKLLKLSIVTQLLDTIEKILST